MLDTLRRITQEVNVAHDLEHALNIIVQRVKKFMGADVCSVFLRDQADQRFVLMATDGLRPESVGNVRMTEDRGLVTYVAKRAEPINLDNAPDHPRFCYFPDCSSRGNCYYCCGNAVRIKTKTSQCSF